MGVEWQKIKKEPAIRQYMDATLDRMKPSYTKQIRPIEAQIIAYVEDMALFASWNATSAFPRNIKKIFHAASLILQHAPATSLILQQILAIPLTLHQKLATSITWQKAVTTSVTLP